MMCGAFTLAAQDFLITMKSDTLLGKTKIMPYDVVDRVQINDGIHKNQFTATQIKLLFLNNEFYGPVRTENGYRMMKLVKLGYVCRYLGRGQNTLTYDVDYLVRQDGQTLEVPNVTFRKGILEFFKDCKTIEEKMNEEKLGKKHLDRIIELYNQCIDQQTRASRGTPAVDEGDPKLVAMNSLKKKLEPSTLTSKTDAIDILNDMIDKVKKRQPVPKYLLESLKGILKDVPDYQPELEKLTQALITQ